MSEIFAAVSGFFLPALLALILVHGFVKKAPYMISSWKDAEREFRRLSKSRRISSRSFW